MWKPICKYVTYPLWDLKDGLGRLGELRSLQKSQWWSKSDIASLQLERLKSTINYAFAHCEFYRTHWGSLPRIDRFEDLRKLPLLEKREIASAGDALLSAEFPRQELIEAKTGGSTGTALRVYFDELCQKKRNAAAMRTDGWAGWEPGSCVGALWGTPPIPTTPKEKLRNALHDRLFYLDTMRMDANTMRDFAVRIQASQPDMLFGHAHSLFVFARFLREAGIAVTSVRGIISTSMVLLEKERKVIEQVFGCPVTNRYGCEEVGLIASECEVHSGMHLNSEHVFVEFLDDQGNPVAPGAEGRIVVTDLINRGMPLIRYVIGDLGVPSDEQCSCGRALPMMYKLTGRSADYLKRLDGSVVAGISLVEKTLTAIQGIEQLQIIQVKLDEFELNVVPADRFGADERNALVNVILDVFGEGVRVVVNTVERLGQERNSKYRFSICRI